MCRPIDEVMRVKDSTVVSPPHDDEEYTIKWIEYGQGDPQLRVTSGEGGSNHTFRVTNQQLWECTYRQSTRDEPPLGVLRAVEYHGYHVTNIVKRPKNGLYENVRYLKEMVNELEEQISDENILARSGVNWASDSLEALAKLELLRAHLSDVDFDVVLLKSHATLQKKKGRVENGFGKFGLRKMVLTMVAYAQKDGYLNVHLLPDEVVSKLTMEVDS